MKRIKLTQKKFALVDDADYEWLNQWKWCAIKGCNTYYAVRAVPTGKSGKYRQKRIAMHRQIMGFPREVDHQNGNGWDNRRANLREATTAENQHNQKARLGCTSRLKGVSVHKREKKWQAQICVNRKVIHLGHFSTQTEAGRAYDKAAIKYFDKFARLNFPKEI